MSEFVESSDALKKFIQQTFRDDEMIDYDEIHKIEDRLKSGMTYAELTAEMVEDSQKVWKFLSEKVIFRDSN